MKKNGISLGFEEGGLPVMRCRTPSDIEDVIWTAVEKAVDAGWTVKQFRSEAATAWDEALVNEAEEALREWRKP